MKLHFNRRLRFKYYLRFVWIQAINANLFEFGPIGLAVSRKSRALS